MTDEPRDLDDITSDLGESYQAWKSNEKKKEKYRIEFFKMATKKLASQTLAQKTIVAPVSSEEEATTWANRHFPTWRVIGHQERDGKLYVALEEHPEKQPFEYTNPHDGNVYKRTIQDGSILLDDGRLKEEDPELWERITFVPEPERTLRPEEEIDPHDLAIMQQYMYTGPPTAKLAPVRKAKVDDNGND